MITTNQTILLRAKNPMNYPAIHHPAIGIANKSFRLFFSIHNIIFALFFLSSLSEASAQANLEAVTFGSGEFIAIASNGEVVTSADGINWETVPAPSGNWQDIVYGNNLFVVVGPNSAMTSPDGENWTSATVPSGGWSAVVYNNSLYVASAEYGSNYVMTSPDGISWTQRTPAYTWPHNDLAFGQISGVDRFVAVCQLGRGWIASNPTGTWSQINPGAIVDIRAVTFGNGKFVWLQWGGSGTVYAGVSTNGINFSASPSGVLNNWNSLVYGNNTYVAVASGGSNARAAYSSDGASWSYGNGMEANSWQSVAFGNNRFVAVSNSGTNRIMYSTDGINWQHDVVFAVVNTDPAISTIDDFTTCPDSTTTAITITISDAETTSGNLLLSAESDNETLLPNANIELSGNTAERTMVLRPVTGQTGVVNIQLTVTDEAGATAESAFTVRVEDLTAPMVFTNDITVPLDENGQAVITPEMIDNGSTDNCGIASMSLDTTSFDCDEVGNFLHTPQTMVEQLDFGFGGGSNSHWQSFTAVGDTYLTSIEVNHSFPNTIQNTEVFLELFEGEGTGGSLLAAAQNTQEGVGGSQALRGYNFDNILLNDGQTYTWRIYFTTAQDVGWISFSGNNPYVGGRGEYCCGSLTDDFVFRVRSAMEGPPEVTLTVTDMHGNTASASAKVTVEDQTAPMAQTKDITIELDEYGQAVITPEMVDEGSTDNCGIDSLSLDISNFDCTSAPQTLVTLTVTDSYGNSAVSSAMITVEDQISPVVLTKVITVQLDENGQAVITPEMVDDGSTDNCGIESLSLDISNFDCTSAPQTLVMLNVTDSSGNSASSGAMITIEDRTAPVVLTKDITVQLNENGQAVITPEMVDDGTSDNCSLQSLTLDINEFSCSDIGIRTVTLTVEDASGNSSMRVAMVTVEDPNTDYDNDAISDVCDPDDDNDGTPDTEDEFPFDPTKSSDVDDNGTDDPGTDPGTDPESETPEQAIAAIVPAEAFTPNGDGNNDTWMIPDISKYPNNMVHVYNRWGHEVFSVKSYQNDWDGFYKNKNEKLSPGSYLYIINLGNGSAPVQGWLFIKY